MNAVYTVLLKNQEFRWANHLNWLKDLASLISRGRLFQRTAPLWLKLFFVKLVRGNGTISAHECACASADCVPLKSCKQLILFVFEMYGKQGFKAVHKTVHLVKLIGKGCSFFFSSAYVMLLSTIGCKVLYSYGIFLAAQQQYLYNFSGLC